jgi:hypothetical protein
MKKSKFEHEFPHWRYHKDHEPRLVKDESDADALPGGYEEWHDNPTAAENHKFEVHEVNGRQHVRRVKGFVPEKVDVDLSHEQGHVDSKPEENLAEASEERLREILVQHGYPSEKLEKKSKKQLLKMLAE